MKSKFAKHTPIEWMHPSWRDLVIDHLASDDQAREAFLCRCGLQGFLLALSSAGGATGQRQSPLLTRTEDWDALIVAVPRVIGSDPRAAASALTTIREALQIQRQNTRENESIAAVKLINLAETTLNYLRDCWSKDGVDNASLLDRYYSVSELLPSLVPSPELRNSWKAYSTDGLAEITQFDSYEIDVGLISFKDWVNLASVISRNEPRFLRQVGFPTQFEAVIAELLPKLKERAELNFDLEDADECRDEQSRLDEIADLAEEIATLFPHFAEQLERIAFLARLNERRVDGRRVYLEEEREPDDDDFDALRARESLATVFDDPREDPLQDTVSVNKLFEDL
ncbi:MAG: hypothetical protein DME76_11680 [Verrucomicrobia bacterium]|nr:MAG: hypothetical protein DME76_11680 [Verrucomicrobiota bacterium]